MTINEVNLSFYWGWRYSRPHAKSGTVVRGTASRAPQGCLQPPPPCVTRIANVAGGRGAGDRRRRRDNRICLSGGRKTKPPTSCSFPWSQLSFQNAGPGLMWLMKARCGSPRCNRREKNGAFLTQKQSQTDLRWLKYMALGSASLLGNLLLMSVPQILFSTFFF